jgi:hypothetical protein
VEEEAERPAPLVPALPKLVSTAATGNAHGTTLASNAASTSTSSLGASDASDLTPTPVESLRSVSTAAVGTAPARAGRVLNPKAQAAQDLEAVKAYQWRVGLEVEVLATEEGYRGAWFPAVVRTYPQQPLFD